ncbi:MAG: GH23, partial [uncultured Solirubrobacteraceae bacterium]
RRQGPRSRAHRRRHLHRVALPRSDLAGRRQGAHADHAGDRRLHRREVGRQRIRAGRPRHAGDQHRVRLVVSALPARPLPRERGAGPRRLQRRRGQGRRVGADGPRPRRALPRRRPHPVSRDARLRRAGHRRAARLPPGVLTRTGPL